MQSEPGRFVHDRVNGPVLHREGRSTDRPIPYLQSRPTDEDSGYKFLPGLRFHLLVCQTIKFSLHRSSLFR